MVALKMLADASPNGAQIGFCFICLDRFGKVCTQTFCTSKSSCTNEGASKCVIFYPILFDKALLVAMRNHQFPFSAVAKMQKH